jgi:hypothetical protein
MPSETIDARKQMPLLARHEGSWKGTYTFVDRDSKIIDQHDSLLECTFPDEGPFPYFQRNHYTWPDGRTETIEFPGTIKDGKLFFDTERIDGYCWEIDDRCIVLHWVYKADASITLTEIIILSPGDQHRTRTWHWFKDGVCFQRTLINELRVSS